MIDDIVSYPRISIVTPSYNQGQFLEQTIDSVLSQNYPNLDYIIIDGGSTDNSIEIIKKYSPYLSYWVSEPDHGQSHAINKGIQVANGEWLAWLNSDDYYLPGALHIVGQFLLQHPDARWVVGTTKIIDGPNEGLFVPERGAELLKKKNYIPGRWLDYVCTKWSGTSTPQISSFWWRAAVIEVGGIDERYHYAMDHDLYGRLAYAGYDPQIIPETLAVFRKHNDQKTNQGLTPFLREETQIVEDWIDRLSGDDKKTMQVYHRTIQQRLFIANLDETLELTSRYYALRRAAKKAFTFLKKLPQING